MIHVTTTVNGDETEFVCDPRETLLDVLRDRLQLTGAKEGCGTGDCGACSVTIDGRLVCSCPASCSSSPPKSSRMWCTLYFASKWSQIGANLAGVCGISVPCGTVAVEDRNLPVGLQLLGPHLAEGTILRAARAWEQIRDAD